MQLLTVMFCVSANAFEYDVHVVYPFKEKDWKYNTSKHPRTNKIELNNSKFECETDVFSSLPGDNVYSVNIICKNSNGEKIRSERACMSKYRISVAYDVLVELEEQSKEGPRRHSISVTCNPSGPSLLTKMTDDELIQDGLKSH